MEQTKKIYQLPVPSYYRVVLELMSFIPPYSDMRPRQKDVLAELLKRNESYSSYPDRERSKLIFDGDTWKEIANKLNTSVDVVTNVLSELRKNEFITVENGYECLNSKYVLPRVDIIGFNFIERND